MAYEKTLWEDGKTYYAESFNKIEDKLEELDNLATTDYKQLQTLNMGLAQKKLRMNEATKIALMGDSVFWGYDQVSSEGIPTDCTADSGLSYGTTFKANPNNIPKNFIEKMNEVYESNITYIPKVFTGDTFAGAFEKWNPSMADFIIINLGINDAMGAHIDENYRGHIELFVPAVRKLVEREIANGTAVILMTPVRQTVGNSYDTDNRTLIDIYEQIEYDIAQEYGLGLIDGNQFTKNLATTSSIDFTHFTGETYENLGGRLVAPFVGRGVRNPLYVYDGSFLGARPQIDNINITGDTIINCSEQSPAVPTLMTSSELDPIVAEKKGLQADIVGTGKIYWSFYVPVDGMVVIPELYSAQENNVITMKLDFGTKQGKWGNIFYVKNNIDYDYDEASVTTIETSDLVENYYGVNKVTLATQPNIKITTEGWHTIEISATAPVSVFGLSFLSLHSYNNKIS